MRFDQGDCIVAMKVTVLANRDLPACLALNYLWPHLKEHDVTVFLSSHVGKPQGRPAELEHLAFFEQTLCNELLFPALDSASSSADAGLMTFNQLASHCVKPMRLLSRINEGEDLALFSSSEPDLVISIRFGLILREPVLAIPPAGVLNLHSGLLPDYKGVMATFRAMLNGDTEIGTTLHFIDDAGIDTGRVVGMTRLPVDRSHSYFWHVLGLYEQGCELLGQTITRIASGEAIAGTAQASTGNYYSFPDAHELRAFSEQGLQLWSPADVVAIGRRFLG